jgi:hypothetical protein
LDFLKIHLLDVVFLLHTYFYILCTCHTPRKIHAKVLTISAISHFGGPFGIAGLEARIFDVRPRAEQVLWQAIRCTTGCSGPWTGPAELDAEPCPL